MSGAFFEKILGSLLLACAFTGLTGLSRSLAAEPLPELPGSTIGYPTVNAALVDLRSRPGIAFSTQNGWTIATDEAAKAIWSFAPSGHAAHPAAVKREVVEKDGFVTLNMKVLCEASKSACDALVRTFQAMNESTLNGSAQKAR